MNNVTENHQVRPKRGIRRQSAVTADRDINEKTSLMRILPLLFYIKDKPLKERFKLTKRVNSFTQGNICPVLSCFYYLEFARLLVKRLDKFEAYSILKKEIPANMSILDIGIDELGQFDRLLSEDIFNLPEGEITSGNYAVNTLEASIWCLMTTASFSEAILKAVRIGQDKDTTAAVTGGLAGLLYGFNGIPQHGFQMLKRKDGIEYLYRQIK